MKYKTNLEILLRLFMYWQRICVWRVCSHFECFVLDFLSLIQAKKLWAPCFFVYRVCTRLIVGIINLFKSFNCLNLFCQHLNICLVVFCHNNLLPQTFSLHTSCLLKLAIQSLVALKIIVSIYFDVKLFCFYR